MVLNDTTTLRIEIDADTIYSGINKLNSFARMLEAIAEQEAVHGMTKLNISAKIIARSNVVPANEESASCN